MDSYTVTSEQLDAALGFDCSLLDPDKIGHDHLYLSSMYTEESAEVLQKHGITHILQVGYELQARHPQLFQYQQLHIADRSDADIVQHLPKAFKFISQGLSAGRVLVHCFYGQSRSAAVIIAYLMWRDHVSYADGLELVRSCRPRIHPNDGFALQLWLIGHLHFVFSSWPGWNGQLLTAYAQQRQLLWQQTGESPTIGAAMEATLQSLGLVGTLSTLQQLRHRQQTQQQAQQLVSQQQLQLQQQMSRQQQPQQQGEQQKRLQQQRRVSDPADLEQQDLVVLAGPPGQLDPVKPVVGCSCRQTAEEAAVHGLSCGVCQQPACREVDKGKQSLPAPHLVAGHTGKGLLKPYKCCCIM